MRGAVQGVQRLSQQLQAAAETQSSQRMKSTGSTAARGERASVTDVSRSRRAGEGRDNKRANANGEADQTRSNERGRSQFHMHERHGRSLPQRPRSSRGALLVAQGRFRCPFVPAASFFAGSTAGFTRAELVFAMTVASRDTKPWFHSGQSVSRCFAEEHSHQFPCVRCQLG